MKSKKEYLESFDEKIYDILTESDYVDSDDDIYGQILEAITNIVDDLFVDIEDNYSDAEENQDIVSTLMNNNLLDEDLDVVGKVYEKYKDCEEPDDESLVYQDNLELFNKISQLKMYDFKLTDALQKFIEENNLNIY